VKRAPLLALFLVTHTPACQRSEEEPRALASSTAARVPATPSAAKPPPALLYLPDAGDAVLEGQRSPLIEAWGSRSGRCPPEMVDVAGRFCVDRFEATLVDTRLGREVSPYYAPRRADVRAALEAFEGTTPRSAPAFPRPPEWQLSEAFSVKALSRAKVTPNGYVSGVIAREACQNAGKRLCSAEEWTAACRGEQRRQFPYGDGYESGVCNVFREAHPASVLYGDASKNHLDPRLNLVEAEAGPLLRRTGETARCRSDWAGDAVFDMVGNLDEWVDEPGGAFRGGFYARGTANGCDARVSEHPPEYFDYSTGVRCCR
jgi:formylglycine-generating enzyme